MSDKNVFIIAARVTAEDFSRLVAFIEELTGRDEAEEQKEECWRVSFRDLKRSEESAALKKGSATLIWNLVTRVGHAVRSFQLEQTERKFSADLEEAMTGLITQPGQSMYNGNSRVHYEHAILDGRVLVRLANCEEDVLREIRGMGDATIKTFKDLAAALLAART